MFQSKKLSLLTATILLGISAILFQNCDPIENLTANEKSSSSGTSGNGGGGGGQPYDGKPFVVRDDCGDGTYVSSRLVPIGDKYVLYRENCQTIPPKVLSNGEATRALDTISYGGKTFSAEMPAIPLPGVVSWYIQLDGALKNRPSSIYIVDLFETDTLEIARLKGDGHTVICSVSAGTYEPWNPDASQFPPESLGRSAGSGGEKYVDTRAQGVRNVMEARLNDAKKRGCHGVDFDNVDGFTNNTGFPLSRDTQMDYNQYLAFAAHDRDLIMSLNNVPELAPLMSQIFDFAIAEECFKYDECEAYQAFVRAEKPVLAIEYDAVSAQQCRAAADGLISLAYFNRALDGTRYDTCQ